MRLAVFLRLGSVTTMTGCSKYFAAAALAAFAAAATALAHPHGDSGDAAHDHGAGWTHENGIGADPDNDSNPATDTSVIPFLFDAVDAAYDPPYAVITFEPPPGRHGEAIIHDYEKDFGVTFGRGLTWQVCEGQRHFEYDTMCTYDAAPSGKYAAGYVNYLNAPLVIEFSRPVCVVTMAIYPTGGKEEERFKFKIEAWNETGEKLPDAKTDFRWTNGTVRWRNMAGAYYLDQPATKIAVSMKSTRRIKIKDAEDYIEDELPEEERYDEEGKKKKTKERVVRYLIDDLAFVETGCEAAIQDIADRAGVNMETAAEAAVEERSDLEEAIDSLEVSGS